MSTQASAFVSATYNKLCPARNIASEEHDILKLFEAAYSRDFGRTVQTLRFRLHIHHGDAEERAQAAWVRGFECIGQLKKSSSILGWICRIAENKFFDDAKRAARTVPLPTSGFEPHVRPYSNLVALDVDKILRRPIEKALFNAIVDGRSSEDIAALFHISIGAAHSRVSRLRAKLARLLSAA